MYSAIRIIRTETAIDMVRKKSNSPLGNGTIMIAIIAIIKATTVKSFALTIISKNGIIADSMLFCLGANGSLLGNYIFK